MDETHTKNYAENSIMTQIIRWLLKNKKKLKKTDVNYRLTKNPTRRIHNSLKGSVKPSSTKEKLEISVDLDRKMKNFQKSQDIIWKNIENDHVKI